MEHYAQAFDKMRNLAESKARENGEQLTDLLPRAPVAIWQPPPHGANGKANGSS
jgi:hypothetical protein